MYIDFWAGILILIVFAGIAYLPFYLVTFVLLSRFTTIEKKLPLFHLFLFNYLVKTLFSGISVFLIVSAETVYEKLLLLSLPLSFLIVGLVTDSFTLISHKKQFTKTFLLKSLFINSLFLVYLMLVFFLNSAYNKHMGFE